MIGRDLLQLLGLAAGIGGVGAAGREPAPRLGIDGRGDLTFHRNPRHWLMDIHHRDGRQQRFGIGMQRIGNGMPCFKWA